MKIICKKFLSDDEVKNLKGTLLNESHIKYPIIKEDCDCYSTTGDLLFKFRKKIISPEEAKESFLAFKDLAAVSRGRGASAGPIDSTSKYWSKREPVKTRTFSTKYITPEGKESKMRVNNPVFGGIVGYYEPTKSFGNLPCRLTSFTINHLKDFKIGCKYSRAIAKSYKELSPKRYEEQLERADKLPHLKIEDTPFSTITVNRNFQTAVHTDAGDFGFGNMGILEYGHYHGGEFVLPKYGIAVDVRAGDHLCADVHEFHGNLPMFETEEDKAKNDLLPPMFKDNVEVGVKGAGLKYARIALVHYLREKLYEMCPKAPYDPKSLDRVSLNKNKINYQYVINLEKDKDRFEKFKWSEWKRWPATHWKDMADHPLFKKMVSYWNVPEDQHKAKCGCFQSHMSLLKWIVIHELENVLICEDDALLVGNMPKKIPKDGITYLGGFIMNKKITSKDKIEIKHSIGLNELDKSKYRMLMAMSYIIPHWKIAENIVDLIESKDRVRAWDVELNNCTDKSYYIYPAPFIEAEGLSTIRKDTASRKHSTTEYQWK
jgi:hypothetical protein